MTNHALCLASLGQLCRQHGIYELREVLSEAAAAAKDHASAEELAETLAAMATSA